MRRIAVTTVFGGTVVVRALLSSRLRRKTENIISPRTVAINVFALRGGGRTQDEQCAYRYIIIDDFFVIVYTRDPVIYA